VNKYFILGLVCLFLTILLYPVDIPKSDLKPIISSTRTDWGGDQQSYSEHCGNLGNLYLFQLHNELTGEDRTYWHGGCSI
jgi:hypothetical protein